MMKKNIIILILFVLCMKVSIGQIKSSSVEKTEALIDVVMNFAENSPDEKEFAILKLDSLLERELSDENITLLKNAKEKIINLKSPYRNSKKIDVLSKDDLKGFEIKKDKFTNSTFITPVYGLWGGQFRTYIVNIDGQVLLRFVVEYRSSDWIFFNKIIMLTGDEKIEYYDYNPIRSVYYNVEEQSDVVVSDKLFKFLEKIVMNQEADVRLQGDERVYDTKISKKQIKSIENALRIYKKLIDE